MCSDFPVPRRPKVRHRRAPSRPLGQGLLKTGRGLGHHPTARGPAWSRSRPGPRQWAAPQEPHSLQLSPEHRVPAARTHHSGSHGDRCLALPDGAFHTESQGVCEQLLGAPRPRGPARAAGLGWERLPPWAPPPLGTPVPLLTKDTPGGLTGQQTSCPQASTVHVPPASSQLLLGPHCRAEDPSHLLSQPEPRAPQAPRKPARPEQGRTVAGLRLWRSTVTPPPPLLPRILGLVTGFLIVIKKQKLKHWWLGAICSFLPPSGRPAHGGPGHSLAPLARGLSRQRASSLSRAGRRGCSKHLPLTLRP